MDEAEVGGGGGAKVSGKQTRTSGVRDSGGRQQDSHPPEVSERRLLVSIAGYHRDIVEPVTDTEPRPGSRCF